VADRNWWSLDRESFDRSYERFLATGPDPDTRRAVDHALVDLLLDPLNWGDEEPGEPLLFWGDVHGTNVGIVYVVDPKNWRVFLADIS
jgi:hypothetical protein